MKTGTPLALSLAMLAGAAGAGQDAFLSSPLYDVTVTLEYTDEPDPYLSQGYIESYKSVSYFSRVSFGPSFSPEFAAMFAAEVSPMESGATMPTTQISGTGVIESFTLQPAWESDDPIDGRVTSGPESFSPTLSLITPDMAMQVEGAQEDDMPILPLVPTLWIVFNENFSVSAPELEWEYPDFAANSIASSAVVFSVPLDDLGQGKCFEIDLPYDSETAVGTWKIQFTAGQ